jgi:hypothetical protein
VARPIPDPAPVTRATLFSKRRRIIAFVFVPSRPQPRSHGTSSKACTCLGRIPAK